MAGGKMNKKKLLNNIQEGLKKVFWKGHPKIQVLRIVERCINDA